MIKKILLGLAGLILLLVLIGFVLPGEVHVERSTTIAAPPSAVYAHLINFHKFNAWSPWAEKDPNAKYTFEGAAEGPGAKMSWTGNDDVGTGSQTITEVEVNKRVVTALVFGEEDNAVATFTLTPDGDGTKIVWGLDTNMGSNPIGRWFGLFFDSMIGPDYESGLAKLKTIVEKEQ